MEQNFFPHNFTSGELYVIKKIWKDLTEKSNNFNQGICKNIFLIYINIDGLLGDRLFEVFDSKSNGFVDLEDFIKGLRIICIDSVPLEIRGKFLFNIFDVKKESKIEKIYMSTILNSISHKYICKYIVNSSHNYNHDHNNNNCLVFEKDLSYNYEIWTNNCVCKNIFKNFDKNNHDYLEWDEFLNWVKFDDIFIKYIRESINFQIQNKKTKKSVEKIDILSSTLEESNIFESEMWKIGRKFGKKVKRYYLLYGNCLYYYYSKFYNRPKGIIFLSGSLITPIDNDKIEITELNFCTGHHNPHEKRLLICKTEKLRNEWIEHLQKVSHFIPFDSVYKLLNKIGKGAYSCVHKCIRISDSKEFAVKIIDKSHFDDIDKLNLKNEISILKLVSHPNIIHMEGFYESSTHIYFIIDLIESGDLFTNIINRKVYSDIELAKFVKILAECLAYLHELGIIHRDIKPENILCDNITGKLILTDFGLSQMILPNSKLSDVCGTLDYVAPEMLIDKSYGIETDIWSLGIVIYLLYYGKHPFEGIDDLEILNNIKYKEPIYLEKKNKLANDLISKLLDKNPKTRITAQKILSHPFILENEIK